MLTLCITLDTLFGIFSYFTPLNQTFKPKRDEQCQNVSL